MARWSLDARSRSALLRLTAVSVLLLGTATVSLPSAMAQAPAPAQPPAPAQVPAPAAQASPDAGKPAAAADTSAPSSADAASPPAQPAPPQTPAPAAVPAIPVPPAPAPVPVSLPNPPRSGQGTPATVLDTQEVDGVLGKSIRGLEGEDMGRIVDVIVGSNGRVRAAVIDFGGFLGVGSRKIAVDWHALKFGPDGQVGKVTLGLSRNQVRVSPEYKPGEPVVVLGLPVPQPASAPAPTEQAAATPSPAQPAPAAPQPAAAVPAAVPQAVPPSPASPKTGP